MNVGEAEGLRRLRLFAGLCDRALQELALEARRVAYAEGELLLLEGDPCRSVYCVTRGLLRARQLSREGRGHILTYLRPGDCYDLAAVVDGGGYRASVDAVTDAEAIVVPTERLLAAMEREPALARVVSQELAREARRLSEMAKELALHPVSVRLARFLLDHAEGEHPRRRWTQDAIAGYIGTVRDVVGRTLRAFADQGLIRRERGRLVVVDAEELERIARGE